MIILLLLQSAFGVFALLFLVVMAESLVRGHDLPTDTKTTKLICKIISEYSPQSTFYPDPRLKKPWVSYVAAAPIFPPRGKKNFYDLGCGRGALAIRIKKKFPYLSVYAIDNSSIRIACAKLKALLLRADVRFARKNIFDVNLGDADIVYTYLWYDTMPLLERKLQKELKKGALVIANTSHFSNWEPIQKIETLFLYHKT